MAQTKAPNEGVGNSYSDENSVSEEQRQKEAGTGVNDLDGLRQAIQRLSKEVEALRTDRDTLRTHIDQKISEVNRRFEESEKRYRESGGRVIREGTQAGHLDDLPQRMEKNVP